MNEHGALVDGADLFPHDANQVQKVTGFLGTAEIWPLDEVDLFQRALSLALHNTKSSVHERACAVTRRTRVSMRGDTTRTSEDVLAGNGVAKATIEEGVNGIRACMFVRFIISY